MRIINYKPAKNNVLLEEVKVASSNGIILSADASAGYYKVIAVGPMCEKTKEGDYIISTLQMGALDLSFVEGGRVQIPEHAIDGYYIPSNEELENPVPIFIEKGEGEDEELNVIDSEGGDNEMGTELGLRNN